MKKEKKKKIWYGVLCGCILAAAICIVVPAGRKASLYREAEQFLQTEDTVRAYRAFSGLGGYKDAEKRAEDLIRNDPALPYRALAKGDRLTFGTYEQDNDEKDGKEPVEWIVLDRIGDEILLLCAVCLDCRTYNDVPFEPVTWENSAVRGWLNGTFYDTAFSQEEKKRIMTAENRNPDQSEAGTDGGADTSDCVFLLCEKEAGIYLGNEMDQEYIGKAEATAYAASRGVHADEDGVAEWWLRTPGEYAYTAQFVDSGGKTYIAGAYVDIAFGIRPAIWLHAGAV
ncbi:MAG: DUF6273 domain-containing protein [Eubacterium sp.]|nr:DUF6273 domain-containing protein [Eubacterium sp.]